MKHQLSDTEKDMLNKSIAKAEELTKAQIVLATINRCDNYNEIPWKAFALGTSVSGFTVFMLDWVSRGWVTDTIILLSVATILVTGALFSLTAVFIPRIARLLISRSRRETEIFQYAESLFLKRELFATDGRRGILLLVSRFEKQVVIIPDKGVSSRLNNDILKGIIGKMAPYLSKNELKNALDTGLTEIIEALRPPLSEGYEKNELSNQIIEEEGA